MNYAYIIESITLGAFTVLVYAWVMYAIPVKQYIQGIGIANRWTLLVAILFVYGLQKHVLEYYLLVGSGYCKERNQCELPWTNAMSLAKVADFAKNLWTAAFGEGVLFVAVGFPIALCVKDGYWVAFLTGMLSHIVVEWAGINADICATNCVRAHP